MKYQTRTGYTICTILVIACFAVLGIVGAQEANQPSQTQSLTDLTLRQKDAYTSYLELTNQVSNARINAFVVELSKIRTIEQLDSLRTANGIPNPEPLPSTVKADAKKGGK